MEGGGEQKLISETILSASKQLLPSPPEIQILHWLHWIQDQAAIHPEFDDLS